MVTLVVINIFHELSDLNDQLNRLILLQYIIPQVIKCV